MRFFTGRGLCFVFWLPWRPVKLLITVQPLLSDTGQRETDQIDEHGRLFIIHTISSLEVKLALSSS